MKWLNLNQILEHIGGVLVHGEGNPLIKNVVTKRYKIADHTLLFDLYKKAKVDYNVFEKYQTAVVVTDKQNDFNHLGDGVIVVKVEDVYKVYWKFVNYYRNLFQIPVIGITGTCGKTTTKQMVKHILRKYYKVHSTFLSNNGRGYNLKYLLGIDDETEVAVFEMPVAYPGYLTNAINYFQPQIRILLNIDVYHLKHCKTPEAYMKAKTEIVHELDPQTGIIILNADDKNIEKYLDISGFQRVIFFGFSDRCHFQAKDVNFTDGGLRFTLYHQNQIYPVFVPCYGKHNVYNALAAIAAASSAGLGVKEACDGLASFKQMKEHLEFCSGAGGCTIIDDTWNAAPLSMVSALEMLQDIAGSKRKIALLGYMPQLGESEYAKEQYGKIGEKVVETQLDLLFIVSDEAKEIGSKALELGMDPSKVFYCNTGTEIYKILKPFLNKDSIVLLKLTHRIMVQDSFKELKQKIMSLT